MVSNWIPIFYFLLGGIVTNLGQSSLMLRINIWHYLRPLISSISCFDMIIWKG
ncbi:hypothetical protein Goari_019145 [Gossypium aridum]|uniref:Uncharacterized protein n=1 Tax=Gossypium aridum TaxID=34290 RepID=A0A7J8WRW8_GOSAI|nr:hypothetical protein [Gossypium aridum]